MDTVIIDNSSEMANYKLTGAKYMVGISSLLETAVNGGEIYEFVKILWNNCS